MTLERSELLIKPGSEAAFAAAMTGRGLALLSGLTGCNSATLGRGVENPDKFILMLDWDSIDAHLAARAEPDFTIFRELIRPFTVGGGMEHFEMY